jgi:TATA-box binding protein (TBP) (component of TFIID and TFIIIB)
MRVLRPCRSMAGFTCTPSTNVRLDLDRAAEVLERAGYVVQNVEVMLITKKDEETTVYSSGKLLIKTADEAAARRVSDEIYRVLGSSGLVSVNA